MNAISTVAIYARLSQEDTAPRPGEATATERQIADCRERAAAEGWNVLAVFEDPDHSASNLSRRRPEFEHMMTGLADGLRVDAVLAWKLDRLLRHPKEAERIIDLAAERDFAIITLNDPGTDLTNPDGRFYFRQGVALGKRETETMSLRLRRKAEEIAKTGRPTGGGIRAFGLTPGWGAIVPAEAALVQEAAQRILDGESTHSVIVDWDARGVRTPGTATHPEGRKWEVSSLKRMLTSPRIVGDRAHKGVVVGTGVIPALLDRPTWDRLCAVLNAPRGSTQTTVRRHYLTGLTFCGRCGAKLVARPAQRGVIRYCCMKPRGCGGIVVAAGNLEPLIAEAIAQRLDSPAFQAAVASRDNRPVADLAALAADEQALVEVAEDYYVARTVTKAEFQQVRADLTARIDAARRQLAAATGDSAASRLVGVDVRGSWAEAAVGWRNMVARALIDRVTVHPAPRRGTRFDPSRVDVSWRV